MIVRLKAWQSAGGAVVFILLPSQVPHESRPFPSPGSWGTVFTKNLTACWAPHPALIDADKAWALHMNAGTGFEDMLTAGKSEAEV